MYVFIFHFAMKKAEVVFDLQIKLQVTLSQITLNFKSSCYMNKFHLELQVGLEFWGRVRV